MNIGDSQPPPDENGITHIARRVASDQPNNATADETDDVDTSMTEPESLQRTATWKVPYSEGLAVAEERKGLIDFRVVNNDGGVESTIILTGLKNLFQRQLPEMPKTYIARLVYDRTHLSMAILKPQLNVIGGIAIREFRKNKFAEIVFCAISTNEQGHGYGAHLMDHLKDYVKATSPVEHFLTYADNLAIGYFQRQGFTRDITLPEAQWRGYIKDYEGGTLMQCTLVPKIRYLETTRMLLKQKIVAQAKIRTFSKSHIVHKPPPQWQNAGAVQPIEPRSVPAIVASNWSPEMDELSRQRRRGGHYNVCRSVLDKIQSNKNAWPFAVPVDKDAVPDYYDTIKFPMDLASMDERLEAGLYTSPDQFVEDLKLIISNCKQFNDAASIYVRCAVKIEKLLWTLVQEIPEWFHLREG